MQNNKNVLIKWLNLRDRSEIKSHRGQKKPPEEGLKQLDFKIERQFVSANPDKTGRRIRVNDAAVKILFKKFPSEKEEFYYDRDQENNVVIEWWQQQHVLLSHIDTLKCLFPKRTNNTHNWAN